MNKFFRFLLNILLIISALCLLLWLTGNSHVLTAVSKTYLVGQTSVGIYDLDKFPSRRIEPIPSKPYPENISFQLTDEETASLKELNSIAYLVWKNDTLVHETYFENHNQQAVSNSFSAAKSVVALLAAIAIDEGYITSFDTPVGKYLPHFENEEIKTLTLAQILGMSTASNWSESGGNPFSDNARAYYGSDLKGLIEGYEITGTPGEEFIYQSGNTQVTGFVIEMAVGASLSEYAEQVLWKKIGCESEAFWSLDHEDGTEKAYCCLYATARDFGRIGSLVLNEGTYHENRIVSSTNLKKLLTPYAKTWHGKPNELYGLGWWVEKYNNLDVFYARGILGQYIIVVPEKNMVVVRLGHKRGEKTERGHPKDLYTYLDIALSK